MLGIVKEELSCVKRDERSRERDGLEDKSPFKYNYDVFALYKLFSYL